MISPKEFGKLAVNLAPEIQFASDTSIVAQGDSLALLTKIPTHSVSLILTDPPYHVTKKDNICGDKAFKKDQHYLDWMQKYAKEWQRVLKPNGSLYCFCASEMSARLEILFAENFNILSRITWTKPNLPGYDGWKGKMRKKSLRQWYPYSERIIFAEPNIGGDPYRSPFGDFLRKARKQAGLSCNALTEIIGEYGEVNHGGAVSNWETGRNIPSPAQYKKVCDAVLATEKVVSMPPMPRYEDAIRPFFMDGSKEFTDVWTFPSVRPYRGKHPAEKPSDLLEHVIGASTYPGDIVLDCFGGSGSTALSALKLGRRAIVLEIDSQWVARIKNRISNQVTELSK